MITDRRVNHAKCAEGKTNWYKIHLFSNVGRRGIYISSKSQGHEGLLNTVCITFQTWQQKSMRFPRCQLYLHPLKAVLNSYQQGGSFFLIWPIIYWKIYLANKIADDMRYLHVQTWTNLNAIPTDSLSRMIFSNCFTADSYLKGFDQWTEWLTLI